MSLEVESKQRVPDAHTADRLMADPTVTAHLQEPFRVLAMSSSYFDTPTHDLNRLKWALRLRREGDRTVAALKAGRAGGPDGLAMRDEWQCEAASIEAAIDRLIARGAPKTLADIAARAPLTELCRIEFVRRSGILELPGGAVVDMSVDTGSIFAQEKSEDFIELELELLFGDPAEVLALSEAWAAAYGLEREHLSKYERALRLLRSRGGRR